MLQPDAAQHVLAAMPLRSKPGQVVRVATVRTCHGLLGQMFRHRPVGCAAIPRAHLHIAADGNDCRLTILHGQSWLQIRPSHMVQNASTRADASGPILGDGSRYLFVVLQR